MISLFKSINKINLLIKKNDILVSFKIDRMIQLLLIYFQIYSGNFYFHTFLFEFF